jgi:hypothetical protein
VRRKKKRRERMCGSLRTGAVKGEPGRSKDHDKKEKKYGHAPCMSFLY